MITVIDNALADHLFKSIIDIVGHRDFPWYIQPINNNLSKNDYQLIHGVCNTSKGHHTIYSSLYDNLDQLFKQMNLFTCIRLKINLLKREDKILEHGMHVDFMWDKFKDVLDNKINIDEIKDNSCCHNNCDKYECDKNMINVRDYPNIRSWDKCRYSIDKIPIVKLIENVEKRR